MKLWQKFWLSGFCAGSGMVFIVDKLWWKYVAVDMPDHYPLGVGLLVLSYVLWWSRKWL